MDEALIWSIRLFVAALLLMTIAHWFNRGE